MDLTKEEVDFLRYFKDLIYPRQFMGGITKELETLTAKGFAGWYSTNGFAISAILTDKGQAFVALLD